MDYLKDAILLERYSLMNPELTSPFLKFVRVNVSILVSALLYLKL